MSSPQVVTGVLGGESRHRAFFGGQGSRSRTLLLGAVVVAALVGTPLVGWPALAGGLVAAGLTVAATTRTHTGTVLERRTKRSRWRARRRLGTDRFVPYEPTTWADLQQQTTQGPRAARRLAVQGLAAMRANPDGCDGMGWLQSGPKEPGIAWHAPIGEGEYLSVAFCVSGQISGIESASVLARAAEAWGQFLASRAAASSLVEGVQTLTRVLPPDSARQQLWAHLTLDPAAPLAAQESYAEVIERAGGGAMVQRHYVVVRWPVTGRFLDAAAHRGRGRDGWRALMAEEIEATVRGLEEARMGAVAPLTARQTAALILHQQNPTRPVDVVRGVHPAALGLASHDEFSAHVVEASDYSTGEPGQWWHRTAVIHAEAMAAGERTQLWALDLLVGRDLDFLRSIAFHLRLVPAGEAKAAARRDLTRDLADEISDRQHGRLANDTTTAAKSAARRRAEDLAAGSRHHGVEWIGAVTVSARTREGLARACRLLHETCSQDLGIEHLDWQDSYQGAASGMTWPIGRGLRPAAAPLSAHVYERLAGRTEKEAIS